MIVERETMKHAQIPMRGKYERDVRLEENNKSRKLRSLFFFFFFLTVEIKVIVVKVTLAKAIDLLLVMTSDNEMWNLTDNTTT